MEPREQNEQRNKAEADGRVDAENSRRAGGGASLQPKEKCDETGEGPLCGSGGASPSPQFTVSTLRWNPGAGGSASRAVSGTPRPTQSECRPVCGAAGRDAGSAQRAESGCRDAGRPRDTASVPRGKPTPARRDAGRHRVRPLVLF